MASSISTSRSTKSGSTPAANVCAAQCGLSREEYRSAVHVASRCAPLACLRLPHHERVRWLPKQSSGNFFRRQEDVDAGAEPVKVHRRNVRHTASGTVRNRRAPQRFSRGCCSSRPKYNVRSTGVQGYRETDAACMARGCKRTARSPRVFRRRLASRSSFRWNLRCATA